MNEKTCGTCEHKGAEHFTGCATCRRNDLFVDRYKEHPAVTAYKELCKSKAPD